MRYEGNDTKTDNNVTLLTGAWQFCQPTPTPPLLPFVTPGNVRNNEVILTAPAPSAQPYSVLSLSRVLLTHQNIFTSLAQLSADNISPV